ncbi:MAG: tetratricopeptide repeat protein [Candidatus Heimdallarchaeaceae archaeon]
MSENEIEMAMSEEDLVMIVVGLLIFILSFSDVGNSATLSFAAFPSIIVFTVGWIVVRFRRRPLPKQIHQTRSIYLSHIRSLRNYNLISIILFDILLLSRYIRAEDEIRTVLVLNFIALFVLSLIEFAGHITVTDSLEIFPVIEGESEKEYKKNRFELLYGTKYWIWLGVTSAIAIAMQGFIFAEVFIVRDVLIMILQILSLFGGVGVFLLFYFRTMRFQSMDDPVMVVKAAEYYNESDLKDTSIKVLEDYLKEDIGNVAILSKLAVLYVQKNKHDKVLEYTKRILAETEEKSISVPHLISKAHLLRAISLKAKEDYQEAYKEVAASLRYTPESAAARKLRRDLRKILKIKQQEKKE